MNCVVRSRWLCSGSTFPTAENHKIEKHAKKYFKSLRRIAFPRRTWQLLMNTQIKSKTCGSFHLQIRSKTEQVMLFSKLDVAVKDHFRSYFPDNGAFPRQSLGKKVGHMPGQSILDRWKYVKMCNNMFFWSACMLQVEGRGRQSQIRLLHSGHREA